ncbi:hypothetical protein Aduo_006292 [Ancylostoma duodenale]
MWGGTGAPKFLSITTITGLAVGLVVISVLLIALTVATAIFLVLRRRRIRLHLNALNYELQEDFERRYLLPTSCPLLEFAECNPRVAQDIL